MENLIISIGRYYSIKLTDILWCKSKFNQADVRIFGIYGNSLITVYPKNLKSEKYTRQKNESLESYLKRKVTFNQSDFFNPFDDNINQSYVDNFTFMKKPLTYNFIKSNTLIVLTK